MTTVNYNLCECTEAEYDRVKRPLWTKLAYNSRRLYRCSNCSALLLVQPDDIEDALPVSYTHLTLPTICSV